MALQKKYDTSRRWHYVLKDSQCGPVGEEDFLNLVRRGKIPLDTEAWFKGLKAWTPLLELLPEEERQTAMVAACNIEAAESAPIPNFVVSPWLRFTARILDMMIFLPLFAWLLILLPGASGVADLFFIFMVLGMSVVGEAVCLSLWGATPGKMLLSIKVRQVGGEKLTFPQAFWRTLMAWFLGTGFFFSWALSLAFLWASYRVFKERNTTLWDSLYGYRVECVSPGPWRKAAATGMMSGMGTFLFFII